MKFSGVVATEVCAWFGFAGRGAEIVRFVQDDEKGDDVAMCGKHLALTLFFRGGAG